jgi:chemotaxis signal transduction protein
MTNLRGNILPVIDLRQRFALDAQKTETETCPPTE